MGIRYRQKLTETGWIGAAVGVLGPVINGFVIGNYIDDLGNRFLDPAFPTVMVTALSIASLVGWVMILIGRETFEFSAPETVEVKAAPVDSGKSATERYFGRPVQEEEQSKQE